MDRPDERPARPATDQERRAQFFRRFKALRVTALLLVLAFTCLWAVSEQRRRSARHRWDRPLLVDVVLLHRGAVPEGVLELQRSVAELSRWMGEELRRYQPETPLAAPFLMEVHGPFAVATLPPEPPGGGGALERAFYYLDLRRYLNDVDRLGVPRRRGALQLYVVVEPVQGRVRFAEGFNAGDRSVVRTALDLSTVDQALVAMGHELLHALGATDKYDDAGHAREPEGLAEPERGHPQRFAEVMVGEVPLGPGQGKDTASLEEVRVGPATAREIGWLR